MVGVARSQGCRTCRRKKKGCDLKRPSCSQCQRLGITCAYDEKKYTFVAHEDAASIIVPKSIARTTLEVGIDQAFWTQYLPQEKSVKVPGFGAGATTSSWVPTLRYLAAQDSTTRLALNATALMTLGRLNDDEHLVQQGTRLYAQALHDTNRVLQHPTAYQRNSVLASSRFLALFEIFRGNICGPVSSQSGDWQAHIEGTCRILELRGPEKAVDPTGHQMYVDARTTSILSGITLKRPVSFAGQGWSTVPWQTVPRDIRDELLDALLDIPKLLQTQEAIYTRLDNTLDVETLLQQGQYVLHQCVRSAHNLRAWEQRALLLCIMHQTSQETTGIDEHTTLADICMDYGYGFFDLISQYWFASVALFGRTRVMHDALSQVAAEAPDLSGRAGVAVLPSWINPEPYAANIANYAEHFFHPSAGLWGAQQATICLRMGLFYYAAMGRHDSPEMLKMRMLLLRKKNGKAFAMGFLISTAATSAPLHIKDENGNAVSAGTAEGRILLARQWFGMRSARKHTVNGRGV